MEFKIANQVLGERHPVFIVAEISANHGHNFDVAAKMIRKAKECGADAVKFQTYTPDTMTLNMQSDPFMVDHPKWGGQSLYDLYQSAYTPWDWFEKLQKAAEECGILFFSTAFDASSVDFLEAMDVPVHKIASFELIDIPLIKYMARTKKPMILSTGMAKEDEIEEAVDAARSEGCRELMLLKCVSSYPTDPGEMNLRAIQRMREKYDCCIGFSDHTMDNMASVAAVTLGAVFIEKHFILDRTKETPDSFFSINPEELTHLVRTIRKLEQGLGAAESHRLSQEEGSNIFRRSLFAVEDIQEGEEFTAENVRSIRPGCGLKPKYYEEILGKTARQKIDKGTPLNQDLIQ